MGLLSQVESQSTSTAPKASSAPWRNVALRIVSYDVANRITTGVDISSGETVRIRLDEPARAGRDDIDTWSQARYRERKGIREIVNNKAVVPGDESEAGVIIFEAVRPSKEEGVMEARWAVTAAHSAMDASVIHTMARPIPNYKGNPTEVSPTYGIEMIRPITAAPVSAVAEVAEQIKNILQTPFTQAVVRAQDEDGDVLASVVKRPFTDELKALTQLVNNAGAEAKSAGKSFSEERRAKRLKRQELAEKFAQADNNAIDQAAPAFFSFDPLGKLISKLNEEQLKSLKMEVFALEQVYPGEKYKESLSKESGVDGKSFRRDFAAEDGMLGFTGTVVALRQHDEGGTQFTKVRVDSTRPMLYMRLEDIPTPNILPKAAPKVAKVAAAAEEPSTPAADASNDAEPPAAAQAEPSIGSVDQLSNKLAAAARTYGRR